MLLPTRKVPSHEVERIAETVPVAVSTMTVGYGGVVLSGPPLGSNKFLATPTVT
jgi:hypothetical protein